jgi:hypothetical protein
MIERESAIRIYSDALGVKGAKGRLVRIAEGYYEVSLESSGKYHTALLPIAATVIVAAEPESDIGRIEVER